MVNFTKLKLGQITEIQTGPFGSQLHNDDYVSNGTPIVTVEHLGNKYFTTQNLPLVSEEDKNRLYKYILKENDIVFSRVGSVDRCSIVSINEDGWLFSGRCLRVRPNAKYINPQWLYYYFTQNYFKQYVRNKAVGCTMPSLNTELLSELNISFPDLSTQKKIADVLSCIDDKIALNNKTNTELENMAKTIYDYWFTQFDFPDKNGHPYKTSGGQMVYNETLKREIPAGWEATTIESISKRVKVGFVGPIDAYYCDEDEGFPIVRPAEMSETGINYDELRHITKEFYDKNLKSQVHKGDIILSRCGKDGIPNIYESDKEAQVLNAVIIESNREIAHEYFIFDAMRSQFIQDQISNGTSGSVQGVINTKIIANVILPYNKEVVNEYIKIVNSIHKRITTTRAENRNLTKLRDYLLPLLMNGQIEVK